MIIIATWGLGQNSAGVSGGSVTIFFFWGEGGGGAFNVFKVTK